MIQVGGPYREPIDQTSLITMTDVMTHRGPNDRGLLLQPGAALGVRRLSIVDVEGGNQPIANEDERVWTVQNGELFNHLDVRRELGRRGHLFRTSCDTEIIPHLYEDHGSSFPEHLRGMFAIAVWDSARRRAVIARDRVGIKPLYYAEVDGLLVFASELKSVLASGLVGTELDREAIAIYLSLGFFPGPRTPLAGVSKLVPGHVLIVEGGTVKVEQYWEYPKPEPDPVLADLNVASEALLGLLDESVRLRLMSDVPLGAMLSGGLDSSLIVALMSRHMTDPVKTFSVGFAGTEVKNELKDARFVSGLFGTDHQELELPVERDVDLAQLVWNLDEPVADLSTIGFSALCGLASQHVTVALSGQGADELLAGYSRHRVANVIAMRGTLPGPLRNAFDGAGRFVPRIRRIRDLARLDPAARFVEIRNHRQKEYGETERAVEFVRGRLDDSITDPLSAALYLDARLGLVDDMLHYFDRMSMAHSLEVRVPFLDHKLVELCAQIPVTNKVHRLTTKFVLKRAARGILPEQVIDKAKVGFFNNAVPEWTRGALSGPIDDYLRRDDARSAEFVTRREVESAIQSSAQNGSSHASSFLLTALMLEIWLSSFVPRAVERQRDPIAFAETN